MASRKKVRADSTGRQIAEQVIARRKLVLARRAKAIAAYSRKMQAQAKAGGPKALRAFAAPQTLGYLVAAGDSWFDYPGEFPLRHDDVISLLEERGYNVESCANAGDPVEAMAYNGNGQIYELARCFEKIAAQGAVPKAVLLSGGGDDIAGAEFGMLLDNAGSQAGGWNDEIVDGVINRRIAGAYRTMIEAVQTLSDHYAGTPLPILVHGYDYAVPDGRGFLGGGGFLPGPWLQPGFREKQFGDLARTTAMVRDIIDRFNAMLSALANQYRGTVHYVDLRGTLSNSLTRDAYQKWWANELHPTPDGFKAVTDKFAGVLDSL